MIKLNKIAEPATLIENSARWTSELLQKISNNEAISSSDRARYNKPDVKNALLAETHGKCAYCESKLRHITYGDIEHISPKSLKPELTYKWENLTVACDVCNTKKADHAVNADTFVDPYLNDPEDYFWFYDAAVYPRPGNEAAEITQRLLELNRAALIERRRERVSKLLLMLGAVERSSDPTLKKLLWSEFSSEGAAENEYAATARAFIQFAKNKLGM